MIHNYIRLDINKFIADYYFKRSVLPSLKTQLESMDGMTGITYKERVQESPSHDNVEKIVIARDCIRTQIEDAEEHIKTYEAARELLTDTERTVIDIFFTSENKTEATAYLEVELGISTRSAYYTRNNALNKLSSALFRT